jgi:UDP-glucose 4-epimerase
VSEADCQHFAANLDLIYYLAHQNTPVNSDLDSADDTVKNLVPLLTLIKVIKDLKTKPRVVYFSSGGAVYGNARECAPFREEQPCDPVCSYGVQKLAAEHYLRIAALNGVLSARILRVGNAFGALLPMHRTQGLIGVALNNILHRKPVRVFGNPENVRDYIHLEDIADVALRVADGGSIYSVLNVGSGQGHSVNQILQLMEDCLGIRPQVEFDDALGGTLARWSVLDISKARRELQWEPRITLRAGIAGMVDRWNAAAGFSPVGGVGSRH